MTTSAAGATASHAELVRRASQGDGRAWAELVQRFGPLVRRAAMATGLNQADAADSAQLTWLRLFQHLGQLRDPERLPGWLATTARRESVRLAVAGRRQVPTANPDAEPGPGGHAGADDVYPVEGDYEPVVEQALSLLPPRCERLLRLLMDDGCPSYTEVAARTGMPIGSIGPTRQRSLLLLRDALAGAPGGLAGQHRQAPAVAPSS